MLVSGKLNIPGSDRPLLDHPRLRDAIPPDLRLLLLVAPPGSGTTSLITQWVATLPRPTAWYTLDRGDADPVTFARYLAAGLATIAPAIADALVGMDAPHLDPAVRAKVFADAVNEALLPATLVLDDLDLIETDDRLPPAIAALLDALLLRCSHLHVVIASRHVAQLGGVARLLPSGEAAIIDGGRLHFTAGEIDQVWAQTFGAPDPAVRDQLLALCGGWATAVALAAATHRGDTPLPADTRQLLYAYLATQVLNDLPPDLQQWMEDVAVLDYLQAERCDQLLQRHDSARYLAEVDRRSLFVVSLGDGQWRYQPLFRDFLLNQLRRDPLRYNTLLEAAAALAKGERAPQWALELAVQSGAWSLAVDLLEAAGSQLRHAGQHATLLQWLDRVPAHAQTPALWRLRAQVLQDQGQLNEALVALDQAVHGSDEDHMMANVLRAQIVQQQGQFDQAAALIAPYLDDERLPAAWRARVLRIDGMQHYQHGEYTLAQQRLQAISSLVQLEGDPLEIARVNQNLGVITRLLGDVNRAEQYYRLADAYWQQAGAVVYRCTTLNNLGMTLLERGRVPEAKQQFELASTLAQHHHLPRAQALTQASLGDVAVAQQQFEEASTLYESAYKLAAHHSYARTAHYALAQLAHTLRLQSNKAALAQLLDDVEATSPAGPIEHAWIAAARAGTYWVLNLPGALEVIDEALAVLPQEEQNDRAFIRRCHV